MSGAGYVPPSSTVTANEPRHERPSTERRAAASKRPQDERQVEERRERQVTAADVLGEETAGRHHRRAEQLLGRVPAAVGDERPRAQRAAEEMRDDPDLHRHRRRQPEIGQQEERPRERRLRMLIEDEPAAVVRVPGWKLVEVAERHARRLPQHRKVAPVVGGPEAIEAETTRAAARAVHDHRRGQGEGDGDAANDRPGPRCAQCG